MDIGNISQYADLIKSQNTSATKLKENINSADYGDGDQDKLLDACKEFEAYFVEQMFKEMQKTVDCFKSEEEASENAMMDYFEDIALQDLASTATKTQGLGLAQTLYEQMKRNYGIE